MNLEQMNEKEIENIFFKTFDIKKQKIDENMTMKIMQQLLNNGIRIAFQRKTNIKNHVLKKCIYLNRSSYNPIRKLFGINPIKQNTCKKAILIYLD